MAIEYCLKITDYSLDADNVPVRTKDITIDPHLISFQMTRTERAVGELRVVLSGQANICDVRKYDMIEVYRSCDGGPTRHYRSFFIETIQAQLNNDSGLTFLLIASDTNIMLEWRQVALEQNRGDRPAGNPKFMMTDLVDTEFGPLAVTYELAASTGVMIVPQRDLRTDDILTIDQTLTAFAYPPVNGINFTWRDSVLSAANQLVDLTNNSNVDFTPGDPLYLTFDMAHNGDGTFTFTQRNQQLGTDRRGTLPPLCADNGSLGDVIASLGGDFVNNFIYGTHSGTGIDTPKPEPEDGIAASVGISSSISRHYWGLREETFTESKQFDSFGFATAASVLLAKASLADQFVSDSIVGQVIDNEVLRYGCNFFFGDRIDIGFSLTGTDCGTIEASARITAEEISFNGGSDTSTRVQLTAEADSARVQPDIGNPTLI